MCVTWTFSVLELELLRKKKFIWSAKYTKSWEKIRNMLKMVCLSLRTYFHVFFNLQKEAFTLPSLGINHHWAFRAYSCLTKQVQKIPLIFLIIFPELLATFKKLCFRIPLNDNFWNCKTLYRYNNCARYLRIPCLNVLYLTCTNSHNFLNFDFGCFANANFYKLLNQEFFGNTKFCGWKIFSFFLTQNSFEIR